MTAYSLAAAAYTNAKLGSITAKNKMMSLQGKKLQLTTQLSEVGRVFEDARKIVRTEAKNQAKETNDSEERVYIVIDDEKSEAFLSELGVETSGTKDELIQQIDDEKQILMAEVEAEMARIDQQSDLANAEYAHYNQEAQAWQAQLQADIQDFHTYGYTQ